MDEIRNKLKELKQDNIDKVFERELKNKQLFELHKGLNISAFSSHQELFDYCFATLSGYGALDIGTGCGVFLYKTLTSSFEYPRICVDPYPIKVQAGWDFHQMNGLDVLNQFKENSFDYVQSIETLEHLSEEDSTKLAADMIKIARKAVLITSCGLSHHTGPENEALVAKNPAIAYQGQPNIQNLMDLGYSVRLIEGYQILAWYIKD